MVISEAHEVVKTIQVAQNGERLLNSTGAPPTRLESGEIRAKNSAPEASFK